MVAFREKKHKWISIVDIATELALKERTAHYHSIGRALNPLLTNGFSHSYQLDESTFILGASGAILKLYIIFL